MKYCLLVIVFYIYCALSPTLPQYHVMTFMFFYIISIVYFQCIIVNALWNENITLTAYSSQQNSSNYSSHPQFITHVNGTQCLYLHFSFDNG